MKVSLALILFLLIGSLPSFGQNNFGIGVPNPQEKLDVNGAIRLGNTVNSNYGTLRFTSANGLEFYSAAAWQKIPTLGMLNSAASAGWSLSGNAGTTSGTNFIGTTDAQDLVVKTSGTERMRITSAGNVGIGTNAPNAPLQFPNTAANRKIVLYDIFNDNHQFYGFGINSFALRYQTDGTSTDHVFYAATSSTTSNELMRIRGNGNVGIGTGTGMPTERLTVVGNSNISGNTFITGTLTLNNAANSYTFPTTRGTAGNVLQTDGAGTLTWASPTASTWGLTGNAGTNPATDFIGTTDAQPLILKAGGQQTGRIGNALGNNNFIGLRAGINNPGINNSAFGAEALFNSTVGSYNVALGDQALYSNAANGNVAVGVNALLANTSGSNNTGMGYQTMFHKAAGSSNISVGYQSGNNFQDISNSVLLGYQAGGALGTPSATPVTGNVFIGHQAGGNETGSDKLYIANTNTATPLIYGDFTANRLGIGGINNPNATLQVNGNISLDDNVAGVSPNRIIGFPTGSASGHHGSLTIQAKSALSSAFLQAGGNLILAAGNYNSAGNSNLSGHLILRAGRNSWSPSINDPNTGEIIFEAGAATTEFMRITNIGRVGIGISNPTATLHVVGTTSAVAWTATSDRRYKENIQTQQNALTQVLKLRGVTYTWNKEEVKGKKDIGFIAQEVEEIFPEIVQTNADGYKSMEYGRLTSVLAEAVKELAQKVEALERENAQLKLEKSGLKTELEGQNAKIGQLESQIKEIMRLLGHSAEERGKK
jgi:Chaperone of endosialidase